MIFVPANLRGYLVYVQYPSRHLQSIKYMQDRGCLSHTVTSIFPTANKKPTHCPVDPWSICKFGGVEMVMDAWVLGCLHTAKYVLSKC